MFSCLNNLHYKAYSFIPSHKVTTSNQALKIYCHGRLDELKIQEIFSKKDGNALIRKCDTLNNSYIVTFINKNHCISHKEMTQEKIEKMLSSGKVYQTIDLNTLYANVIRFSAETLTMQEAAQCLSPLAKQTAVVRKSSTSNLVCITLKNQSGLIKHYKFDYLNITELDQHQSTLRDLFNQLNIKKIIYS